jgi:hypothetical protein
MAALAAIAAPLRTSSSIILFPVRVAAPARRRTSNCCAVNAITKRKLGCSRPRTITKSHDNLVAQKYRKSVMTDGCWRNSKIEIYSDKGMEQCRCEVIITGNRMAVSIIDGGNYRGTEIAPGYWRVASIDGAEGTAAVYRSAVEPKILVADWSHKGEGSGMSRIELIDDEEEGA